MEGENPDTNRELNSQSVLSYGGLLMPKTNGATPDPKTPAPFDKEKTKFSNKFKGIFGQRSKTIDSENELKESNDFNETNENIEIKEKKENIPPIVLKEPQNPEPQKIQLNKEQTNVSDQPRDYENSESPNFDEDDELQSRKVNESKVGFETMPDPVLVATHSNERKDSVSSIQEEEKSTLRWLLEKTWHFIKFFLKQVLFVGIILAYAIAGAFAFQLLEQHNEQKSCQESKGADIANVITTKAKLIEYVQFNITSNVMDTTKDNETYAVQRIEEMLTEYRDQVLSIGYDGSDCSSTAWIPVNGILFCLTIVTTIGYGHVFPVTWEGQIFCIVYATIGIPLFIMCTANISPVLGYLFRWTYVKVCCGYCNYRKKKKSKLIEGDSKNPREIGSASPTSSAMANDTHDFNTSQTRIVDDHEDIENEMNEKDEIENASVPLTITILTITCYIGFGAIIFHFFEGWLPIESAYFCFVTLTTIGFGDFTPGQNFDDPLLTVKLGAGCLYILLGLAILGMGFDLMQEEIIAKFTWFGKKVGLLDKDEEDEEEEEEKEKSSIKSDEKEADAKSPDFSRQVTMATIKESQA